MSGSVASSPSLCPQVPKIATSGFCAASASTLLERVARDAAEMAGAVEETAGTAEEISRSSRAVADQTLAFLVLQYVVYTAALVVLGLGLRVGLLAGPAPFDADGLDWFAGMAASQVASLGAATAGRAAKERYESADGGHDPELTAADEEMLTGPWSWVLDVVLPAVEAGPQARIDDDLAFVSPWGFAVSRVVAPVLFLHGGRDRVVPAAHSAWLATHCPGAELRFSPDDGHLSILDAAESALEWLRDAVVGERPCA